MRTALTIMTEPVEREPGQTEWRLQLAIIRFKILDAALVRNRWDDAVAEAQAALKVLAPLEESGTVTPAIQCRLADIHLAYGKALERLDRPVDARVEFERALAAIELVAPAPGVISVEQRLAMALLRLDRIAEAEPVVRRIAGTTAWDRSLGKLAREKGIEIQDED